MSKNIEENGSEKALVNKVTEINIKISKIVQMIGEGRVLEAFGSDWMDT